MFHVIFVAHKCKYMLLEFTMVVRNYQQFVDSITFNTKLTLNIMLFLLCTSAKLSSGLERVWSRHV